MVGAERMVGPEQQMPRTEHLVATGKRLVVIAHGVNIKVGECEYQFAAYPHLRSWRERAVNCSVSEACRVSEN